MIIFILTIVFILTILIITIFRFCYQKKKFTKCILIKQINIKSDKIPKYLFQTYNNINKIPPKVFQNIEKYAPDYKHFIYDDTACKIFLKKYFVPEVLKKFNKLKLGAHKADLWRYCVLYIYGGITQI